MPVNAVGAITQDQFIQLLIAQLQNQDPLEPVGANEYISQLSSLSTVQGLQTLNVSFAQMLQLQQLSQGISLVGKTVDYIPFEGGEIQRGIVDSLTAENGQFVLRIGDLTIGLEQLVSVLA